MSAGVLIVKEALVSFLYKTEVFVILAVYCCVSSGLNGLVFDYFNPLMTTDMYNNFNNILGVHSAV